MPLPNGKSWASLITPVQNSSWKAPTNVPTVRLAMPEMHNFPKACHKSIELEGQMVVVYKIERFECRDCHK